MDEVPKQRLCCVIHPYYKCPACEIEFCQSCLYGWMGARTHPVPPKVEGEAIRIPSMLWMCAKTNRPIYRNHMGYYAGSVNEG